MRSGPLCAYRADGADGAGDRGNTPGSSRLPGRGLEFEEHIEGQEHAEHVRRDLGPDQPVHPEEAVQEEQHMTIPVPVAIESATAK